MKCPICGNAKLVQDTRDISYTYKGETTNIPAVTGEFCPACGEAILGAAESTRTSALMLKVNRSGLLVKAKADRIVTPEMVKELSEDDLG